MISAASVARDLREMAQQPTRRSVSESITANLVTVGGPYDINLTPYMREPADALASRKYKTVCFVGPGRTSKTATLIDGWTTRIIVDDPGDTLIVQASQDLAQDYSEFRVSRFIEASEPVRSRQTGRRKDDKTFSKAFRSGMRVAFGWPSSAQLSGRDFKNVAVTEYDAAADDIDNEGSLYALAMKRTQTFLSAGKVMVESSVRRICLEANWQPSRPHELPPASGITGIYNAGTMKQFCWQCETCGHWLVLDPDIHGAFRLPSLPKLIEELPGIDCAAWARKHAHIYCERCGCEFEESRKRELSGRGLWLPSGCSFDGRQIVGTPRDTQIDSYSLGCQAAAYQSWFEILEKYAIGIQDYIRTGNETEIKTTVNLDQGRAYRPISIMSQRASNELQGRAEDHEQGTVPHGVRFIVSTVDVQAGRNPRFVVQVTGYGVGLERWIIDRFALRSSQRPDGSGDFLPLDPASYSEDWNRLIESVIDRRYPLADGSGRSMPVKVVGCDSGGKAGVTPNAYKFWRHLRSIGKGHRLRLVKGADRPDAPRVDPKFPDARGRSDRDSGAVGDVPVLILNSTMLKDGVMGNVWRESPGPGYFHFPSWLPTSFYDELTAEVRGDKRWVDSGKPNESLDLAYYADALATFIEADKIDWRTPPLWAQTWDLNPDVRIATTDEVRPIPQRRPLRQVQSSYLRR